MKKGGSRCVDAVRNVEVGRSEVGWFTKVTPIHELTLGKVRQLRAPRALIAYQHWLDTFDDS